MQQHLEALAANMEYEHAAGRLSAICALRDVVSRFPAAAVETHATFLFVPMVGSDGWYSPRHETHWNPCFLT